MPDHLHLFATPKDLGVTFDHWITFFKSRFSKTHSHSQWVRQTRAFHHRLRSGAEYSQKRQYVLENPVRAGLAREPREWPYQGVIHEPRG